MAALPSSGVGSGVSLGIYAKLAANGSPSGLVADELRYSLLRDRFYLQGVSRRLLPDMRVTHCLRSVVPGATFVQLQHDLQHGRGRLGQLQVCRSVWVCPICQLWITEQRRADLGRLNAAARSSGLRILLNTLTFAHGGDVELRSTLGAFLEGLRALTAHRRFRELRSAFGMVGWLRALEVTWGQRNGWHPHGHLLVYLPVEVDAGAFADRFRECWSLALAQVGLSCDSHGFAWSDTDARVAEYVAKFGRDPRWDESAEMTKTPAKRGRLGRLSPLDLLRLAADGDLQAAALFREYAGVFKGRAQLSPSKGLSELLLGESWRDDAAVMEAAEGLRRTLALLARAGWSLVTANDAVPELLRALDVCDAGPAVDLLDSLGVDRSLITILEE